MHSLVTAIQMSVICFYIYIYINVYVKQCVQEKVTNKLGSHVTILLA